MLANIGLKVILGMLFLTFCRADIWFAKRKFVWRTYIAVEVLPTTGKVEIIDKKVFAAAVLNADDETFVVHIVALAEPTTMSIYLSCQA